MINVRPAAASDVADLVAIRTHYVLHTHAAFDTEPPTVDGMRAWMTQFAEDSPYQLLVAVDGATVCGFAATMQYRPKPAFDGTVEVSIYLRPDVRARGVGSALYSELLPRSAVHGTLTYLAGVALPNPASLAFHRRHGFEEVGTFVDYAHKWGEPISSTWLQRR